MEQHEFHELHDRWQRMIDRMARLFQQINTRIDLPDDQVDLNIKRQLLNEIYHHGYIETNLRWLEPSRLKRYEDEKQRMDDIERDINDHDDDVRPLL
jgi:hypothetical protein